MSKVIPITLSVSSINKATKEILRDYFDKILRIKNAVEEYLFENGVQQATLRFGNAIYAGDKGQVSITAEKVDETVIIRASGEKVLFIEFGAGIRYESPHMEDYGFWAGMYGEGRGNNPGGWFYKGTETANDPEDTEMKINRKGEYDFGVMHTYGSPANAFMYETEKELIDGIVDIVRRELNGKQTQ